MGLDKSAYKKETRELTDRTEEERKREEEGKGDGREG